MNMIDKKKLKIKLELVEILFNPNLTDLKGNLFDNDSYKSIGLLILTSATSYRAYYIAHFFLTNNRMPTKDDLEYINKTLNKLIKVVQSDKEVKDDVVFDNILCAGYPFSPSCSWVSAYNKLIKLCK